MKNFTLVSIFTFCLSSFLFAQAGKVDSSFGIKGALQLLNSEDIEFTDTQIGAAFAVQPDNKIIAGYLHVFSISGPYYGLQIAVTRYNIDGSIDSSFGINGTSLSDTISEEEQIGIGSLDFISQVLICPDGKIIASAAFQYGVELAKFNSDGSVDESFGYKHKVKQHGQIYKYLKNGLRGCNDFYYDRNTYVAILANNKIAGASTDYFFDESGDEYDYIGMGIFGINKNGNTDSVFHNAYYVVVNPLGPQDTFYLPDLYGAVNISRFQPDTPFASSVSIVGKLNGLPDGKMLLSGKSTYYPTNRNSFAMARLLANGLIDSVFAIDGILLKDFDNNGQSEKNDVVVQSNGKILVSGTTIKNTQQDFSVVRYLSTGVIDSTFGTNGMVVTPFGNNQSFSVAMAQQNSGKIIVAGNTGLINFKDSIAIVRYTPRGDVDSSFGKNGRVVMSLRKNSHRQYAYGLSLSSDGNLFLLTTDSSGHPYLIKYFLSDETTPSPVTENEKPSRRTNISLSPNPASNILRIENLPYNVSEKINIVDMAGRNIKEETVNGNTYSTDVSKLSPGTYFVKIYDGKNTISSLKFIKQ